MPIVSDNPMWETFGLRALACASYGGAEIGECLSTVAQVTSDSPEDWYRQWTRTAERLLAAGITSENAGHTVSAREAYFRASTYFHISYFPLFGAPVDPWLANAFMQETDAFLRAARLSEFPIEPVEVPFEGTTLPGYLLRPADDLLQRTTILQVNGYDSNIQEMYFAHGPAAVRRGYNVLLLDGPGQGRNLIRDGMHIRPDWETVVGAAINFLLARPEVDPERIVLAGRNFGGYLAPRAAAYEKQIAALIADPGLWDQRPDLSVFHLPPEVVLAFPDIDPCVFDAVEDQLRSANADPMMRWKIVQRGMWVHGVDSLYGLVCDLNRFEIAGVASQIGCPTLITAEEGDPLSKQSALLYEALTCPKQFIHFTAAEGADGRWESLGRSLYHQRTFDWLDATLGITASPALNNNIVAGRAH